MFKTTPMSLIELMILKKDVKTVIEFLGKNGNFQFQSGFDSEKNSEAQNQELVVFQRLKEAINFLWEKEFALDLEKASIPNDEDKVESEKILSEIDALREKVEDAVENYRNSEGDEELKKVMENALEEKKNFSNEHEEAIFRLANNFSIGSQIQEVQSKLESTSMVYRLTGWLPEKESHEMMKELDSITEGRIAIRVYEPHEVPSVVSGREKVPVKVEHGKLVKSFERMIFSYGSPTYGSIDPTPFVAIFFTILFGIMFGDAGQGLVFLLAGILMAKKVIKVGGWNKFAPIFIAIGCTSTIMGILTGEFFANEELLLPVSRALKTLFGVTDPEKLHGPILHMMPSAERVKFMFMFFGFTIAVGFIINSCGLILNIVNNFVKKHPGKAIFGKTGITGMAFFYYVIAFAIRIAAFGHTPQIYDWVLIGVTLFFTAFGEIFERLVDGERPVLENGFGTALIQAVVEVLEIISSYLSNSISFLRVGAFALAHAVLGYIISSMTALAGGIGGIAISVFGNVIVIVLEGMIVAIQVIRLQYYEFFSKFFNETGREFVPFRFK